MKKIVNEFRILMKSIAFCLKHTLDCSEGRRYAVATLLSNFFGIVSPVIFTVYPGMIVNELIGQQRVWIILIYISIMALVPMLIDIINLKSAGHLRILGLALGVKLFADMHKYRMEMDYEHLENPQIRLLADRAITAYTGINEVIDRIIAFAVGVVNVVIYSFIIARYNVIIILIIMTIIIINFIVRKNVQEKLYDMSKQIQEVNLEAWAIDRCFETYDYGKEFRLYNLKDYIINRYKKTQKTLLQYNKTYFKKNNKAGYLSSITTNIQQFLLYGFFVYQILCGKLGIGDLTIGLSAAGQFSGKVNALVQAYLAMYNDSLHFQDMEEYLNLPNRNKECGHKHPVFRKDSVIEFKNVSFRYPGSERYSLKNFNIKIYANEKLCVVGENGAGKSTFIKLLTRLFFPTEGEILLDGVNINEFDCEEYRSIFATVFQDFVEFYFLIKDNIVLASPENEERLKSVCQKVGLDKLFSSLPLGYDTQLTKNRDESGFEPSGGEAQRIAIAKALYHGGDVFLLDEPTAALDPMAEYEIYTQFNDMITDKCAILITHRLSAVQLADKVAVFDDGHVAEYGTHAELYAKGGIYTEMFDKQAKFYRDAPSDSNAAEADTEDAKEG